MDEQGRLAALRRHWEYEATDPETSHEIYHDDAVLEFPQSQERFEGKETFIAWRKKYPAALRFQIRRIRGLGDLWIAENSISYNDGPWNYACSILEFSGDKVARETKGMGGAGVALQMAFGVEGRVPWLRCPDTG